MTTEPAPFSAIAYDYDAAFTGTAVGRLQRHIVWDVLEKIMAVRPLRVLEINCGTGEDALRLARRGCRVLATDASQEMVAIARDKARAAGVALEAQVCDFAALAKLPEQDFDLILSNFGGLNCLPPEDLPALWTVLTEKLRPGGHLVTVVMGRFCWWETLYFLLKGRMPEAFRRLKKGPVNARLDHHTTVPTWYFSPAGLPRNKDLSVKNLQAVGFWLPPSYLNPFFEKRPRLLRVLFRLEKACRGAAWARGADHFLLHQQKTP